MTTNSRDFNQSTKATMNSTYLNKDFGVLYYGYSVYEEAFKYELRKLRVAETEINSVWTFINDTFINARTESYPKQNQFVLEDVDNLWRSGTYMGYPYLYTSSSDQSRRVDFGLKLRENADLWLSKDLYKTTLLVNGKKQEYLYNKKKSETDAEGNWTINLSTGMYNFSGGSDSSKRASNADYNGTFSYSREIRKSEYLYDGSDAGTTDSKNLQVFVTYKIAVKNQSQSIPTSIDEIVDYYDGEQYDYISGSTITRDNTFIGDKNGNKSSNLTVSASSKYANIGYTISGQRGYSSLYLTGFNGYLEPGELTYAYITFKVKNDSSGKVKLDQENLLNGGTIRDTIGKRNIAEINGYSTREGLIDLDSNPGSLRSIDLNANGDIISSTNEAQNRLQDDTDKSSNIKLKIDTNTGDMRSLSGYVFEDARTEATNGAVIGNGKYNTGDVDFEGNRDKKINGVTVQLVELVQEVNSEGFSTGRYLNEKVWSSVTYNGSWNKTEDASRYYSGTNKSKVILSGQGAFKVDSVGLPEGDGQYRFDSVPPGDFYIRFIYGDTTQTVLTNQNNQVNNLIGQKGLNENAYTGQDYKSTVYQSGVNQNTSYNGINGYRDTTNQNYGIRYQDNNPYTNETIVDEDKQKMYNYDIASSNIDATISDAKDVYSYREKEQSYSSGSNLSVLSGNEATLKNHRAEVLASGTDLVTKASVDIQNGKTESAKNYQKQAINELINNTSMVSQTGVIDSEIEYNRKTTQVYDNNSKAYIQNLAYQVQNINLGLTERPRAQLNIAKELENIQIKLANGQTLFDANQSVANLIYQKHKNYSEDEYYTKVGSSGYRLRQALIKTVEDRKEELVQATLDEELMSGATIRLKYKISASNIGEVDYLDKNFYYLGKTSSTNWSNVAQTSAKNVLDYVTNEIKYEESYQEAGNEWKIVTTDVLLGNNTTEDDDYVNSVYEQNLKTFNVLVTTNKLSAYLVPRAIDTDKTNYSNSRKEVRLVLSTLLANTTSNKNLIFNNMVELIESKNTFGRRMHLSRAGNHYVPYQSENKTQDESTYWLEPNEPDEDSGQKVTVSVPTGENRNFNRAIVLFITASAIIAGAVVAIKKKVLKDKN